MDAWKNGEQLQDVSYLCSYVFWYKRCPKPTAESLKVDSLYFDDILKFSIVRNPYAMYCFDYPSFALSQEV